MESNTTFKSMLIGAITGCLLVVACETKTRMDSTKVAEEQNETKFAGTAENDAFFITDVAKANLCEVKTAQLGAKKAKSPEVKAFANMMIEHHNKMYKEVSKFAIEKNISIPDTIAKEDISDYSSLKEEKAKDFDKKFMDIMVKDHKKVIDQLEDVYTSDKYDQDIKSMAAQTLPMIRNHYEKAKELQAKMDGKI